MRLLLAALLLAGVGVAAAPAPGVSDAAIVGAAYPQTLAEYRFFADPAARRPVAGVVPYRLNTPLWSDGADKTRFVYVPAGTKAHAAGEGLIDLPVGSALIKHFAFGGRLVETRVLLHRPDGWVALPYRWDAAQGEARLVLGGARVAVTTPAGETISYAIPNKNQCKECHALAGKVTPIGPKAWNLAPQWLAAWHQAGHLDAVPAVARRVPLWEDRAAAPVAEAARGYLEANCAHCHNPQGAASNSGLFLGWEVSDPVLLGRGKRPVAAGRGSLGLEFDIAPGDPEASILYRRMASREAGVAMPELGTAAVDPAGLAAVRAWIAAMR